jgi:hypothetical protein
MDRWLKVSLSVDGSQYAANEYLKSFAAKSTYI